LYVADGNTTEDHEFKRILCVMEAARASKAFVSFRTTTGCHNPEDLAVK